VSHTVYNHPPPHFSLQRNTCDNTLFPCCLRFRPLTLDQSTPTLAPHTQTLPKHNYFCNREVCLLKLKRNRLPRERLLLGRRPQRRRRLERRLLLLPEIRRNDPRLVKRRTRVTFIKVISHIVSLRFRDFVFGWGKKQCLQREDYVFCLGGGRH